MFFPFYMGTIMEMKMKTEKPEEVPVQEPVKRKAKVKCSKCGSDNIYKEKTTSKQWVRGKEEVWSGTVFTCLNLECGHTWRK